MSIFKGKDKKKITRDTDYDDDDDDDGDDKRHGSPKARDAIAMEITRSYKRQQRRQPNHATKKKAQPKEIPRQSLKTSHHAPKNHLTQFRFFFLQIFISITKSAIFLSTSLNKRLGRSCHSCNVLIVAKL